MMKLWQYDVGERELFAYWLEEVFDRNLEDFSVSELNELYEDFKAKQSLEHLKLFVLQLQNMRSVSVKKEA